MREDRWEPGKVIAFGEALVIATSIITGVMTANWSVKATATKEIEQETGRLVASTPRVSVSQSMPTPSASDIEACNQYAKSASANGPSDILAKAAIGGAIGSGVGATSEAIADGREGPDKGAAIGGIVWGTAGTLYGLNDANQKDARAVVAYRACMREHGHTSD